MILYGISKNILPRAFTNAIEENEHESRKSWLLKVLSHEGRIWFWEEGYHREEIIELQIPKSSGSIAIMLCTHPVPA